MSHWITSPIRFGLATGVVFGLWNLAHTRLFPLADDTILTLLRFYGPMFALWGLSGALAARSTRSWVQGVRFAALVAFITFCVYDVLVILRINLFLNELTGRADWQSMMQRFRESESDNLHNFVTMEYIKGSPFKIGVATAIGTVFGCLGASVGRFMVRLEDAKVEATQSN